MSTLFQWDLIMRHGVPVGVGIVSGHRTLMEGTEIHTSPICHVEMAENNLHLKTTSGNIYQMRMKEWRPRSGKTDPFDPEPLGLPADFWTQCARARDEASRSEKADLRPLMKPGALFMRVVGARILSALWAGRDSRIRDASVGIHLGAFQDSYLIAGAREESPTSCNVDLRLFPMRDRLEPYHISQGIKLLQVRNEGCTDITFGLFTNNILCPSGAITAIPIRNAVCDSRYSESF